MIDNKINKIKLFLLLFPICWVQVSAQSLILCGHSHNDYLHKRPLYEAVELGFGSIEIDVCLDQYNLIKVSHNPSMLNSKKTIEQMYFDPILKMIETSDPVFKYTNDHPLTLMIDIKTDRDSTYKYLKKVILKYSHIMCMYNKGTLIHSAPVKVCISGNKPWAAMCNDSISFFKMDANLQKQIPDSGNLIHLNLNQLIITERASAPFGKIFTHQLWNGKSKELNMLKSIVKIYHEQGIELRLYAAPENKKLWKTLLDEGVDWINVDNLQKFARFYKTYKK